MPDPIVELTMNLVKPGILACYKNMGYTHIRQIHKPYDKILRAPSSGCIVELLCYPDTDCHFIDSPKARKLMRRQSYFGYL